MSCARRCLQRCDRRARRLRAVCLSARDGSDSGGQKGDDACHGQGHLPAPRQNRRPPCSLPLAARTRHRSVRPRAHHSEPGVRVQAGHPGDTVPREARPRILRTCDVGSRSDRERAFDEGGPTLADTGEQALLRALTEIARTSSATPGDRSGRRRRGLVARARVATSRSARTPSWRAVDFRRWWISPRRLGARALTVALSDLAGMGATPVWCSATLCAPSRARASRTFSRSSAGSAPPRRPPAARSPEATSAPSTGRWSSMSWSGGRSCREQCCAATPAVPGTWWWSPERSAEPPRGCACCSTAARLSEQEQAWVDAQLSPGGSHRRGPAPGPVWGALRG